MEVKGKVKFSSPHPLFVLVALNSTEKQTIFPIFVYDPFPVVVTTVDPIFITS